MRLMIAFPPAFTITAKQLRHPVPMTPRSAAPMAFLPAGDVRHMNSLTENRRQLTERECTIRQQFKAGTCRSALLAGG